MSFHLFVLCHSCCTIKLHTISVMNIYIKLIYTCAEEGVEVVNVLSLT